MSNSNEKKYVSFAAIDPYIERRIVSPVERVNSGNGDMVEWGDGNQYPEYLFSLYQDVTSLRTIINGNIDFIAGDRVSIASLGGRYEDGVINTHGDNIEDVVRDLAKDYNLYGGFALQIIRDHNGDVAEIYYMDMRYLRSNKENTVFYYSEKWSKSYSTEAHIYPAFVPNLNWTALTDKERERHALSVLFVKNVRTQVYPSPVFAASVKSCEIERNIDEYHLNAIENGFSSSAIVNFNNGMPDDKVKEAIEEDYNEKFSGHQNAGRIMFSWNKDRTSATTVTEVKVEDFGERYTALAQHSRQQIFSAFRAQPLLFGLNSDVNTGFSTDEFEQCFKLYNRTVIRSAQNIIANAFDKIYQSKEVLSIIPFSLNGIEQEVN